MLFVMLQTILLIKDTFKTKGEIDNYLMLCSGLFNVPHNIGKYLCTYIGAIPQPTVEHALADHCRNSQGTQVTLLSDSIFVYIIQVKPIFVPTGVHY